MPHRIGGALGEDDFGGIEVGIENAFLILAQRRLNLIAKTVVKL